MSKMMVSPLERAMRELSMPTVQYLIDSEAFLKAIEVLNSPARHGFCIQQELSQLLAEDAARYACGNRSLRATSVILPTDYRSCTFHEFQLRMKTREPLPPFAFTATAIKHHEALIKEASLWFCASPICVGKIAYLLVFSKKRREELAFALVPASGGLGGSWRTLYLD